MPGQGARVARLGGPVPQVRDDDDQRVADEGDAHQQGDGLGQRDRDLQDGTVHEADLRYQRRTGAHKASPSRAVMMTVSTVRLTAMQMMLISEPRTRCPTW